MPTAKKKTEESKTKAQTITIQPLRDASARFLIEGIVPLVQNRFPEKVEEEMRQKQEAGSQAKKGRKREAKDFAALSEASKHISVDGWNGLPAAAFRSGMISACRLVGFKMTIAKLSVWIMADGVEADGTALVRITKGKPRPCVHSVRNATGVADLRPRSMWDAGWQAVLQVGWDSDQFSLTDVTNLLVRVGHQVGIQEGRPDSKMSAGMGWGRFKVVSAS